MRVAHQALDTLEQLRLFRTPGLGTVVKMGALATAGAILPLHATTGIMHRGEAHRSIEFKPSVYKVGKVALGMLGLEPHLWQEIHRRHHAFTDIIGKDPHTPVGKGRWSVVKNAFRNVDQYKAESDKIKQELADGTFVPMDNSKPFEKGRLDVKAKWWKPGYGIAAGVGAYALIGAAVDKNAALAASMMFATGQLYKIGGDLVNSLGHAGKHPLRALFGGWITPYKKGEAPLPYASDAYTASITTGGEGSQGFHHNADLHPGPQDYWFAPTDMPTWKRIIKDPAGALNHLAVKVGLAWVPPMEERMQQYTPPEPVWPEDLVAQGLPLPPGVRVES